jgi:hypothetical protein
MSLKMTGRSREFNETPAGWACQKRVYQGPLVPIVHSRLRVCQLLIGRANAEHRNHSATIGRFPQELTPFSNI